MFTSVRQQYAGAPSCQASRKYHKLMLFREHFGCRGTQSIFFTLPQIVTAGISFETPHVINLKQEHSNWRDFCSELTILTCSWNGMPPW